MSGICLSGFFTMSRICPGLTVQNLSKILYRTNTGRILDKVRTCQNFKYQKCVRHVPKKWTFSGHIRFIPDIFQTFLITFSGHLFFIGRVMIFLIFWCIFLSFHFASYFLEFFWGVGGYPKIDRHRWLGDYFLLRELGVCVRRVQILVISF